MIGIVTVNWNGFEMTRNLVIQILQNEEQNFRLAVVNNSPADADRFQNDPVFSDPRAQIIHSSENVGYSGGLNLGIKALLKFTEISHFLLSNNDITIDKNFIRQLQLSGKESRKIYAPLILYRDTEFVQNTGGSIHIWLGGGLNMNKNVPLTKIRKSQPEYLSGCILYVPREIVENVGFFDEVFGSYCEDVDYCYRSKAQGFDLEVLWDVKARHFHSFSTQGNNAYKIYLLNRNQILLAKKHLPPGKKELFILASIVRGAVQSIFHKQFSAYYRGVVEALSL